MSYIKIIEELIDEHTEQKEAINNFREQNFELREDLGTYKNQYNKLFYEHEQLKQRISKLVSENTTLQNDLFSEQLIQDETEDYINRLKEENKSLIELKNIWFDSHRLVTQERDKLEQELKEYRGY